MYTPIPKLEASVAKESKEIRTRSKKTDVRGDSTTWHSPGLRRLHFSTLDS